MVLHFGDAAGIARRTQVVVDVVGHAGDGNVFGSRRLFSECDGIGRRHENTASRAVWREGARKKVSNSVSER